MEDYQDLVAAEDAADLEAARAAMASRETRVPHAAVLAELGLDLG